jgi:hypothetical protein
MLRPRANPVQQSTLIGVFSVQCDDRNIIGPLSDQEPIARTAVPDKRPHRQTRDQG